MITGAPSRTAMVTSLIRAHHTRTSRRPLHVDPWGDRLVTQEFKDECAARAYPQAVTIGRRARGDQSNRLDVYLGTVPSYASVIFRARYAEDALARAAASGFTQYVQIGAGFDSFALRQTTASELRIIEVDHPATQSFKRQRITSIAQGRIQPEYIAADLSQESLQEAIARSTLDSRVQSFISWLGVSVYLTRGQNDSALRSIASCFPRGSLLVFTYTDAQAFDGADVGYSRMRQGAAAMGEPFLTGFVPAEMSPYLHGHGLELIEDYNGPQLAARYAAPDFYAEHPAMALTISPYSRLALARVA